MKAYFRFDIRLPWSYVLLLLRARESRFLFMYRVRFPNLRRTMLRCKLLPLHSPSPTYPNMSVFTSRRESLPKLNRATGIQEENCESFISGAP